MDPRGADLAGMRRHKFRVRAAHESDPNHPLHVQAGEILAYERRKPYYTGWIWCTAADGTQAWVPEKWVEIRGGRCRMIRAYCSDELTIQPGESVAILEMVSGWAWVEKEVGLVGWVPLDFLERP